MLQDGDTNFRSLPSERFWRGSEQIASFMMARATNQHLPTGLLSAARVQYGMLDAMHVALIGS